MREVDITEERFTQAMRDAVAERGRDWAYPQDPEWRRPNGGCRYFLESGEPACLIGTALSKLGVGPDQVREGQDAWNLLRKLHGTVRVPKWIDSAADAQRAQDRDGTWGEALDAYLSML